MKRICQLLLCSKNEHKAGVFWNSIAYMLFGLQSLIINVVLRMFVEISINGIFAISFSNAMLFLTIGKYAMKDYQVSDTQEQYSFNEYRATKMFTTFMMVAISGLYTIYASVKNEYSLYKSFVMILMCILKSHDAIEDVYYCHFIKNKRLDIAGKIMSTRLISVLLALVMTIIVCKNLLTALIVANVVSLLLLFFYIIYLFPQSGIEDFSLQLLDNKSKKEQQKSIITIPNWEILVNCFPLFLGAFLAYYVNAASKIAIDSQMDDESMGIYGFLTMPVFVISLMNNIIFTPQMMCVIELWKSRKINDFIKKICAQISIIGLLTFACVVCAWFFGVQCMSFIFNIELNMYKVDIVILLFGSGLVALSDLFVIMATIIRYQNYTVIGYIIGGIAAFIVSEPAVKYFGIRGATVSYIFLAFFLCVCFCIIFIKGYKNNMGNVN